MVPGKTVFVFDSRFGSPFVVALEVVVNSNGTLLTELEVEQGGQHQGIINVLDNLIYLHQG